MTTERFNGSDCTLTSGVKNRVLTISNIQETNSNDFQVFVNNSFLHLNIDYTINHKELNSTITFLNYLWDNQKITVVYSTFKLENN